MRLAHHHWRKNALATSYKFNNYIVTIYGSISKWISSQYPLYLFFNNIIIPKTSSLLQNTYIIQFREYGNAVKYHYMLINLKSNELKYLFRIHFIINIVLNWYHTFIDYFWTFQFMNTLHRNNLVFRNSRNYLYLKNWKLQA